MGRAGHSRKRLAPQLGLPGAASGFAHSVNKPRDSDRPRIDSFLIWTLQRQPGGTRGVPRGRLEAVALAPRGHRWREALRTEPGSRVEGRHSLPIRILS